MEDSPSPVKVDSGNRTVGQHSLEIPDAFMDGGRSIPVETDGDTLGDTLPIGPLLCAPLSFIRH